MRKWLIVLMTAVAIGSTAILGWLYVGQDRKGPEITIADSKKDSFTADMTTEDLLEGVKAVDEKDGDANTYAKNKLSELNKIKEIFSIEIIEAVNSYTRAGMLITVDDINYLIESTDHSIKNGVHYVKLGLRRYT